MLLRKSPRTLTPEEIRERNIQRNRERILNPPKPSLWDRAAGAAWAVEEWWCRHVTQRDLYRRLDAMRLVMRPHLMASGPVERLRSDVLYPGPYPGGCNDDQS